MSRSLWIGFICYFFSLPERNCLCLCTSAETATEGNTHLISVSSQQPHQPTSIPLIAQAGKRRKKGKRSRSAKIPERVRCGVASVFRISSHRSPPYYLASYWRTLTSLHVRFYHLVRLGTSTLGNRLRASDATSHLTAPV